MARIEIRFLTEDRAIQELCRRYWQLSDERRFVHSVSDLAKTFDTPSARLPQLVKAYSEAYLLDDSCLCGNFRLLTSRSDLLSRGKWHPEIWICADCLRDQRIAADHAAREKRNRKVQLLQKEVERAKEKGALLRDLSFTDAVYLVSLLRAGGSEDLSCVSPCSSFDPPLSPTREYDREILKYLYDRSLICVDPGSKEGSVNFKDDRFDSFVIFDVSWLIPLPSGSLSPVYLLEHLENLVKSQLWPEDWASNCRELSKALAIQECLQYLRVKMEEHGFELKPGDKTRSVIGLILEHFSIGQVYSFIWRAARDVAAFSVRERVSKSHAANLVPGSLQRMADRAIAAQWDIKPYGRDFRAPQSVLSGVVFTSALKLTDGGLTANICTGAPGTFEPVRVRGS